MTRTRKPKHKLPNRAELHAELDRLEQHLPPPRPWLRGFQRDPRLAAALRRNIERHILTRN